MHQMAIKLNHTCWPTVKLADLTQETTERNESLILGPKDVLSVDNERGLTPSGRLLAQDLSRYKLVKKNRFAYNPMRLNVGSIGLWKKDAVRVVSPDYVVFGCDETRLDPDYLVAFFRTPAWRSQIQQSGQGSIRIRYYYSHIAEFWIPLPSLSEQQEIAAVLRSVQDAMEASGRVITATRQLKQSLFNHLFTYGPIPYGREAHVSLKATGIGLVPERWNLGVIGDFSRLVQYGLSIRGATEGSYPMLRMNNLQNGKIVIRGRGGLQYVDLNTTTLSKFRLEREDLLFNRTNSFDLVGKTSLFDLEGDFVFASYLVRLRLDDKRLDPRFANYYLNMPATQARLKFLASRGVSQSNINATKLKGFEVPVPSLSEQREIVAQLSAVDAKLVGEETRRAALDNLFQSLLHHLMSGQIRVNQLGGQESLEEAS